MEKPPEQLASDLLVAVSLIHQPISQCGRLSVHCKLEHAADLKAPTNHNYVISAYGDPNILQSWKLLHKAIQRPLHKLIDP